MSKHPGKVLEKSLGLSGAPEEEVNEVLINLPPVYRDPIVVGKETQENHGCTTVGSDLLRELLGKFSNAITEESAHESAGRDSEVERDREVGIFLFLLLAICLLVLLLLIGTLPLRRVAKSFIVCILLRLCLKVIGLSSLFSTVLSLRHLFLFKYNTKQ